MSSPLGCVLAIRNRPPEVLERTLQTYAYQALHPIDQVLLDYGSDPEHAAAYRQLGDRYGWRVQALTPAPTVWHMSDAYNRAVALLDPEIDIVFKSDTDVLLGPDVLLVAAQLGRERLCLSSLWTTRPGTVYPPALHSPHDVIGLLQTTPPLEPMPSEGTLACPRSWFSQIGGFDRRYQGWGFEDSDLRERGKASIGVLPVSTCLLIHQGHVQASTVPAALRNHAYYEHMKQHGPVVRNEGRLVDDQVQSTLATAAVPTGMPVSNSLGGERIAVVTRSMTPELYQRSGELLDLESLAADTGVPWERRDCTGTDALDYFRHLAALDVRWVINLDEDAFLLRPQALVTLIRHLEVHGYAACGMPDGGVVPIRRHNPAACNAFFNVFDLQRVRPLWADWQRVRTATVRPTHAAHVADFARRSPFAFDHFERYYGVFFTLLDAGERLLYLNAEEWSDGVSTLLHGVDGQPLLLHAWYSRYWTTSHHTRQRYERLIAYARSVQQRAES